MVRKLKVNQIINVLILLILPFLFIFIEGYLKNISDVLQIHKFDSFGYRFIFTILPLINGVIIGSFFLLILFISKKIYERFKHGLVTCLLCLGLYILWYLSNCLQFAQIYRISKYLLSVPLIDNIHFIVAAMILIISQYFYTKSKLE